MKKILTILAIAFVTNLACAETTQVCHDKTDKAGKPVVDKKTGKTAQSCKTITVHKKFEGTAVPEKPTKK